MKALSRTQSPNFLVNIVNLVFISLMAIGVTVELDASETISGIITRNWEYVFTVFVPSLAAIVFRLVTVLQRGVNIWDSLKKSGNFWTQLITVIASLVTILTGIVFPDSAGSEISNALISGNVTLIMLSVFSNIVNPIIYFIRDGKKQG